MALPNPVLSRAAVHVGLLIPVCAYCNEVYGLDHAMTVETRFAGLTHGACPPCGAAAIAEARMGR